MKKLMMTLAAVLCCTMATTVFTACGDDDETTLPVAGKYQYWVDFNYSLDETYANTYVSEEMREVLNALNLAVGLNGNIYEKTYNSRKDAEKIGRAHV